MQRNSEQFSGQIIATSAEVTLNGGLVRESPQNPLNSGLGNIVICPELFFVEHTVILAWVGFFLVFFGGRVVLGLLIKPVFSAMAIP